MAIMAWQAREAIRLAGDSLESEINENGIRLATSLALLLDPEETDQERERQEIVERLRRIETSQGMTAVRHVVVYGGDGEVKAMTRGSLQVTRQREAVEYAPAAAARVRITEFKAEGVPVRAFTRPLESPSDPASAPGRVEVFLSAQHIAEAHDRLSRRLTHVSVLACLLAAAGSLFVAAWLTRPIRHLVKDLRKVSQGDLEHQSTVRTADEMGDLARTFNIMTSNLHVAQEAKIERRTLEHELSVATDIQSRLLPSTTPRVEGLDLAVFYRSAREVGGDYYDFVEVDDSHIGAVVADVSGKGVPGSLVMTMTRSLLRMAATGERSPQRTVLEVDRCLTPDLSPGMFVTLVYLVVDTRSMEVDLVRAGHNAPLLYSRQGSRLVRISPPGVAIGLDRGGELQRSELAAQRFRLETGDVLVAFTDGVVEGKAPDGEDFGDSRLHRLIARLHDRRAQEIVDGIVADLEEHEQGAEQSDDITLVVMRRTG